MEKSNVGFWLQVGANIGILVGLILVWYEINQNSQLTNAALLDSRFQTSIETSQSVFGENMGAAISKSYSDPASLSDEEMVILEEYYVAHINQVARVQVLGETGIVGDRTWLDYFPDENDKIVSPRLRRTLDSPFARAWWPVFSATNPFRNGELSAQLDRLMSLPPLRSSEYYESLRLKATTIRERDSRSSQAD